MTFQKRVHKWLLVCFGEQVATRPAERYQRFVEEALELGQSLGCTKEEALMLVDYVYAREAGNPVQEVGGVMVTLAALCEVNHINMNGAANTEITRIEAYDVIQKIRQKQETKPDSSPLPGRAP
jgi:hypothetical protein